MCCGGGVGVGVCVCVCLGVCACVCVQVGGYFSCEINQNKFSKIIMGKVLKNIAKEIFF